MSLIKLIKIKSQKQTPPDITFGLKTTTVCIYKYNEIYIYKRVGLKADVPSIFNHP